MAAIIDFWRMKHLTDRFVATQNITVGIGQRCFFVGDIHGKYNELMSGLKAVDFNFQKDILVSTGDLIDRGPDSVKCLELVDKDWFYPVYANHEEMALAKAAGVLSDDDLVYWRKNYGCEWYWNTKKSKLEALDALIIEKILKMPASIKVTLRNGRTIGCIHGQMPPASWDQMVNRLHGKEYHLIRYIISMRETFKCLEAHMAGENGYQIQPETRVEGVDALVLGHNSLVTPMVSENSIWIDTGRYGPLTIISAEDVLSAVAKGTGNSASC